MKGATSNMKKRGEHPIKPGKPVKKTKSIKRSLLTGLIGLSAAISILCGVVSSVILFTTAKSNMEARINESVSAYNSSVQNAINNFKTKAEAVAQNDQIFDTSLPMSERKSKMSNLATQYGFVEVLVVDADGNTTNGSNISDRDYFQKTLTGVTDVSSTVVRKTDSTITLMVSAKSKDFNAVVVCVLSSDTFSQMIDSISIGQSGYGFIVDSAGKIIADKNRDNVNNFINYIDQAQKDKSYAGIASVVKNMIGGKAGLNTISYGGSSQSIGYAPIPDTDNWSLAVCAKESEMMSSFYNSIIITVIMMLVFIAASVLIAFRVANPIVNPIIKLIRRIELLADGDVHTEVPEIHTGNEMETLAVSFAGTLHRLSDYIGEISSMLNALAAKDCTVETHQDYRGDFAAIGTSLNVIVKNFNQIFGSINGSAEQIASGAEQLSGAAQTLSQGATEQASSVEELSASLSEVAQQVNENAENAMNANQLSQGASTEIQQGNEQMQQMVEAMAAISVSSQEIGKIIKTIEDIAFQTNILALNAAVEAARAGSAGKGFAVVADEVRNLAGKSAEAAKNTTALIEDSVRSVENGTKIADETARSLAAIIDTTNKITGFIAKITEASHDQATSINQITQGMDQISAVVQTNSATSEENAATSEELSGQAQMLSEMMAQIKLKGIE